MEASSLLTGGKIVSLSMLRGLMPATAWRPNSSSGKQQDGIPENGPSEIVSAPSS